MLGTASRQATADEDWENSSRPPGGGGAQRAQGARSGHRAPGAGTGRREHSHQDGRLAAAALRTEAALGSGDRQTPLAASRLTPQTEPRQCPGQESGGTPCSTSPWTASRRCEAAMCRLWSDTGGRPRAAMRAVTTKGAIQG